MLFHALSLRAETPSALTRPISISLQAPHVDANTPIWNPCKGFVPSRGRQTRS
jgi:hypothetical protein